MKTAYKFRLYPDIQQEARLNITLETCRFLYNLALADRNNAYEQEGISRSYEDQEAVLTADKKDGDFRGVFSQVLQDVLRRLDKSFKAFFRSVKVERNQDIPGSKVKAGYKSFTYPQAGFKLEGSKLTLSKIGAIRIFKHRKVEEPPSSKAYSRTCMGQANPVHSEQSCKGWQSGGAGRRKIYV